jgi:hypothetical protein
MEANFRCCTDTVQLEQLNPKAGGPLSEQMQLLETHIGELLEPPAKAEPARRGLERLNGDAAALYGEINGADAVPTVVQKEETERVTADWHELEQPWRQLREVEVPQLNRALAKAGLQRLVPDTDPPRDLNVADED